MDEGYKILVVDDDPQAVNLLKRLLEKNHILETAHSGKETFTVIPSFRPDLILLDIMMPGMDGYETCRWIREDMRFHLTKIILISAKDSLDKRLKGYEAGADDYVVKPFDKEELKAKIKVFLRLKRSEEVDQIKGNLISLFSHETKTPLSSIIGLSSLLKKNKSLSDKAREYAELIHESGNDLLEFVRKTSLLCELKGGIKLEATHERVTHHLESAIEAAKKSIGNKNITFELAIQKELELSADWNMINRVFGYIFDNAIKHSPNGSSVLVSTEVDDKMCHIRIKDNGDGISEEWIDNVFEEFAIKDLSHHQKGQGLSLAISRRIVELHGGKIDAKSTQGKGATFTISLPI